MICPTNLFRFFVAVDGLPGFVFVSRIFATLAVFSLVLMSAALVLGLTVDLDANVQRWREQNRKLKGFQQTSGAAAEKNDEVAATTASLEAGLKAARERVDAGKGRATLHRLLGIAAALGVVLVSSIAVTYFIGTSRWCREVVETYSLDEQLIVRSRRLKRRSFPWSLISMLTVLAITALGGAADPATGYEHSAAWVTPHLIAAFSGLAIVAGCFYALWQNIAANHVIIETVMQRVGEAKEARRAAT
jgi:hypothetical protein